MTTKMITGVVERVLVRERESGADPFGNTHTRALQIGGQWFNFSGGTKPVWNVKIGDGFKVLGAGSEVAFKATTTVSKTNGKEYTNCSGLMVINLVEGENSPPAGKGSQSISGGIQGSYTPKPKDGGAGISTGHALNGAMNFLLTQGVEPSNENIVKYAQSVHNVTEKVKKATEAKNAGMDAYSVGAMSGNAILNACKLIDPNGDFEQQLEALATDFLDNVVPKIAAHVKGEEKPAPAVKTTRAAPAKKATTKAPPVVEPDGQEEDQLPF